MSEQAKDGIYVYQPFGVQHPDKWKSGRIYGVGGLPMEATCHGFTKAEAEAIRDALIGSGTPSLSEASTDTAQEQRAIQAVNCHADLVEALREVACALCDRQIGVTFDLGLDDCEMCQKAIAALAKAGQP